MASTTSASSSTLSALGSGSGLDLNTLLTSIVAAERDPQQKIITQRQTAVNTTVSALGTLKSAAASFQSALTALKTASTYTTRTATSSDQAVFSVKADGTAEAGNYSISVINLASANKIASGNFSGAGAAVGNGTLTIGVGDQSFDVKVDGTNNSLAGIRDAINNAAGNTSVKASLLAVSDGQGGTATKLVLTSNKTGNASQISITAADSDGNNTDGTGLSQLAYTKGDATTGTHFTEAKAAKDAKITIDGFEVTNATNEFKDAIAGVTINALKGQSGTDDPPSGELGVAVDTSGIKTAINKFVTAYNTYIFTYKQLTSYNATTDIAGPLQGNASISALGSRIRQGLTSGVAGAPSDFNSLANLGITTNADGTLKVDDTKLTSALANRLGDVATIFSGTNGVATRLDTQLTDMLGANGLFQNTQKTFDKQLADLTKQQTALDTRMTKLEANYRAQFTALDTIVAQLKSTGNFLTQQLSALSSSK